MFNKSNSTEKTWITENMDCSLSYNAHPMVRYLADECRKETETNMPEAYDSREIPRPVIKITNMVHQ